MKLCKSCAESLHEHLQGPGDHGLHVSQISDAIRETLHPPTAKELKEAKAAAKDAAVEGSKP